MLLKNHLLHHFSLISKLSCLEILPGSSMVEIEKYFKIEIEIYRIEIFRTEIEIGFY